MFIDARDVSSGAKIQTDLCVVGAGAAGITLAREFLGQALNVCVLESGSFDLEPEVQELAEGENAGLPYYPLHENRRRQFGGTTHLWSGWCRPLDEVDVQPRDWVHPSGWPFSLAQLWPYYRRAHAICELGDCTYDVSHWEHLHGAKRLPLPPDKVTTKVYRLSPPTRFGLTYRAAMAKADNVRVILYANALHIERAAVSPHIERIHAGSLRGNRFSVEARWYVLATGGVENARLLLASRTPHGVAVGNEHDQVGRYFMEHVHFPSGVLWLAAPSLQYTTLYCPTTLRIAARLFLADPLQVREKLLNYNAMLEPLVVEHGSRRSLAAWRLHHTLEQFPNPLSRVLLSESRDGLGMPRVKLEWRTTELDRTSYRRSLELLAAELHGIGLGQLSIAPGDNDEQWPPEPVQGLRGHHMGTTRMSRDPREGVVDENCRVHGLKNLFVAGSSVFPTSGAGTPTLTLVALALRLADHIKRLAAR
jgi:choline dehydrogenase-like flavoprotein